MESVRQSINEKPTVLYDGDCGICTGWARKQQAKGRGAITYLPYQEALSCYPQVTEEECRQALQFIMPDGTVYSGAHAVLHALAMDGRTYHQVLLWMYERVPFFDRAAEAAYQWIAHHRATLSRLAGQKKCQ